MEEILKENIEYLFSLYRSAGYSADELCSALEINPSTYTRWKNSDHVPDSYNQRRIAELFGISFTELRNTDLRQLQDPPREIKRLTVYSYIEKATKEQIEELYELLSAASKKTEI